jgi:GxxExxY protein
MSQMLRKQIINCAKHVMVQLGPFHSESVYHNALMVGLRKARINYQDQPFLPIFYEGHVVGTHRPDLVVENQLAVELKVAKRASIDPQFIGQLQRYMHHSPELKTGLLLCFVNTDDYTLLVQSSVKQITETSIEYIHEFQEINARQNTTTLTETTTTSSTTPSSTPSSTPTNTPLTSHPTSDAPIRIPLAANSNQQLCSPPLNSSPNKPNDWINTLTQRKARDMKASQSRPTPPPRPTPLRPHSPVDLQSLNLLLSDNNTQVTLL